MSEYPSIHRRIRDLEAINAEMRDMMPSLAAALAERAQLITWQAAALESFKQWQRCLELVPGSRLIPGAQQSACVYAYIDHLHGELDAERAELAAARTELEVLRTICADRMVQQP
jgi:hypothetical protein